MNCIAYVARQAWVGTMSGIQRFDVRTLKPIKDTRPGGMSDAALQLQRTCVNHLLHVGNYVWAAHHDNNLISIWYAESGAFVTSFPATNVTGLLLVLQGQKVQQLLQIVCHTGLPSRIRS